MSNSFIFKVIGIFLLTILMSWAVSYVNSIILERQQRQLEARTNINQSVAREQTVIGPVLVVPYVVEYPEKIGSENNTQIVTRRYDGKVYILPEDLNLKSGFSHELKSLGIFKALVYQLGSNIEGHFKIPKNLGLKLDHDSATVKTKDAYISLGISDTRGITGKPIFYWNGKAINFVQSSKIEALGNGMHASIQELSTEEQTIAFDFRLNLRGTESFNLIPIAENNMIALKSSWQSPHFYGSFSPDAATQKIDQSGFTANWAISSLSSSNQSALTENLKHGGKLDLEKLSVGFVEPINVYSQADRATKYGLLFIGLTFAGFFIFEILKQLRIHPAQYTLVGLAMSLFYLLLISLAEQIGFAFAYLAASVACVSLLGYYLSYVLKSKANGFVFASLLTALYGALYGILKSEDNALIMGSLLVFGLLALVMVITRKVDWYQISRNPELPQTHSSDDVV